MGCVEKRRPHYDLGTIQATFCEVQALRITATGMQSARALSMTRADIIDCIQAMARTQFFKSMTSLADARIWQDVYHVPYRDVVLYVKFTTDAEGYLIISFKEC
jgi:motility quorum-sensing regulator/GCU-specific mRNA interferase toxin